MTSKYNFHNNLTTFIIFYLVQHIMKNSIIRIAILSLIISTHAVSARDDPDSKWDRNRTRFPLERGAWILERRPRAGDYLEVLGEQAGIWGDPTGSLEAWAYPFKLFQDLRLEFSTDDGKTYISGSKVVTRQIATPHMAQLCLADDSFTALQTMFVPRELPAGCLLLEIDSQHDLQVAVRFKVSLAPMLMTAAQKPQIRWEDNNHQLVAFEKERKVELRVWSPMAILHRTEADSFEKIVLDIPKTITKANFVPIFFAASWPDAPSTQETLSKLAHQLPTLFTQALNHYKGILRQAPNVQTPDPIVNQALTWSVISLDQLRVKNPFIGYGLVSGYAPSGNSTRPGFCWFFDEPTLTSWAYLRAGLASHVKESLSFLMRYQREDGKMVHEITQSLPYYPDYFNKYKYAYIHSSSGTYFIAACGHYYRSIGDRQFISQHWDNIKKMFAWCERSMDADDGLLRVAPKDWGSSESSFEVNVDTQMAGMWVCALRELAYLANAMNDSPLSKRCREIQQKAEHTIDKKLWDQKTSTYYWGLNRADRPLRSLVPHHSVSFWMRTLPEERIVKVLERMASADIRTDWGVRSLAASDKRFNPQGYQIGTVWPVWNTGIIIADFRLGRQVDAFRNFMSMVHLRTVCGLGSMPEVLNGQNYQLFKHGTPHQMFSEVAIQNSFYDGLLGLEIDVPASRLTIAPRLPAYWKQLTVGNIPIGSDHFNLSIDAQPKRYQIAFDLQSSKAFNLTLRPFLPAGSQVKSVTLELRKIAYHTQTINSGIIVGMNIPDGSGKHVVRIQYEGGVDFSVEDFPLEKGKSSRNLRLIQSEYKNKTWYLTIEGLPNVIYPITFYANRKPSTVNGGKLLDADLDKVRVGLLSSPEAQKSYDNYVRWNASISWE